MHYVTKRTKIVKRGQIFTKKAQKWKLPVKFKGIGCKYHSQYRSRIWPDGFPYNTRAYSRMYIFENVKAVTYIIAKRNIRSCIFQNKPSKIGALRKKIHNSLLLWWTVSDNWVFIWFKIGGPEYLRLTWNWPFICNKKLPFHILVLLSTQHSTYWLLQILQIIRFHNDMG